MHKMLLIKRMFIFTGLVVVTGNHKNGGAINLFPENIDNKAMEIIYSFWLELKLSYVSIILKGIMKGILWENDLQIF